MFSIPFYQVLNRSMDPRAPVESPPDPQLGPLIPQIPQIPTLPQAALPGLATLPAMPTLPGLPTAAPGIASVPGIPTVSGVPGVPGVPTMPGAVLPQQIITSGTHRDCIRMRGLPFEATVQDILTFLGELSRNIVFQGVHMVYNAQVSLSTFPVAWLFLDCCLHNPESKK